MSTLHVENLKGLSSGGNANKIVIPSGQTLDTTSGTLTVENIRGATSGSNANKVIIPTGQTLEVTDNLRYEDMPSGSVVNKELYNSGYGSGARLQQPGTTAWVTMPNTGTSYSGPRRSGNATVCVFNKKLATSKIICTPMMHAYMGNTNSGWGMRVKHARTYSGTASDYDNDFIENGPYNGWGAGGYGGASLAAADSATYSVCLNDGVSAYNSHTGDIFVYLEVRLWSSADSVYWGDYNNTYPKYWMMVIEEVAQ